MKPKELLYSLDHVGEDLLAGAEQTILVRKRRPWAGAAAAAVVLVAMGVGGFFLWKNLRGGVNPAATGEPGGTTAFRLPTDEPDPPSTEPDRLTVGDCWTGLSRARFDDLDRSLAGSLAADCEGLTSLPVYQREAGVNGDPAHRYSDDELVRRLYEAAAWIGSSADDGYDMRFEETENGTLSPASCSCQTDQGTLTVYADGRIQMLYNEAHVYEAQVNASFSKPMTLEETERSIRDAQMTACGTQLAERLGLGECGFVTCDRWDPLSSAWTVFTVYPLRENPGSQLVSRWFERVQMLTNDGKTLRGFVLDRHPGEAEALEGLRLVGTFPIRSEEEAVEALLRGSGLCEEALVQNELNGGYAAATLVYLPDSDHALLMPFYRFWFPAEAEPDCDEYLAVYVPAITDACLADWPVGQTARSLDSAEEAAIRALFDPENPEAYWYLQALNGQYETLWNLDLGTLFRCAIPGVDNTLSQSEREALTALGADLTRSCRRLPGEEVDAVLSRVFGMDREQRVMPVIFSQVGKQVSSDEVSIDTDSPAYQQALAKSLAGLLGDGVYYVPELDCYYDFRPARDPGTVTILALSRDAKGQILVTYDASRLPYRGEEKVWTAGLQKDENTWRIRFNVPGEWAVPEPDNEPAAEPTEPDDPQPTDDTPEPTAAPDGYQPMPVLRGYGEYEIAGPAGSVGALQYLGPTCQDPVWADLDGDGFRELIYWCYGPTSGIFTVGICVYGLEEGWPVLEASQIFTLEHGDVSLSEENGSVFFHPSGQTQTRLVTLKDGKLQLGGGLLPDEIREWGSPEYGWFGSSFD